METAKWRLFSGIILLTIGVVLRVVTSVNYTPLILILAGVGFKVWHISFLIRNKKYKPGHECWFLLLGLVLFFSGLYLFDAGILKYSLMSFGILFKAYFVIQLIRKSK